MATFTLQIKTPEREVFHGDVDAVSFHSETGKVSFLAHHGDYTASLQYTRIMIQNNGKTDEYIGRRGMASFHNKTNKAELLLLECHAVEEVSLITAKAYLEFVEQSLRRGDDLSKSQLKFMQEEKIMLVKQMKDLEE